MLEDNVSIQRKKLTKKMFEILYNKFGDTQRFSDFDLEKVYIDFTEQEKEKSSGIDIILTVKTIPNQFFILYSNKKTKDLYFLVSDNEEIYDEYVINYNLDIIDLLILSKEDCLQVSESISEEELYNRLCVYEDDKYSGHTCDEIISLFKPFLLYKVNDDFFVNNAHGIYAYYLLCIAKKGNFPWEECTLEAIENVILSKSKKIPYYNIILSLSSKQWPHIFLESYRMIEHLFCVVFLKDVSDNTGIDSEKLAEIFENTLNWRPPEEEAIRKIFYIIETKKISEDILKELNKLKKFDKKSEQENLYKWYYKEIRNQIAHYRTIHKNVKFSDREWNTIIRFNFIVIKYMYEEYDKYLHE